MSESRILSASAIAAALLALLTTVFAAASLRSRDATLQARIEAIEKGLADARRAEEEAGARVAAERAEAAVAALSRAKDERARQIRIKEEHDRLVK